MLARLGYRADVAGNGLEVLEALERQPYDLVLMDVHMPEMDGVEATRHVRSDLPADQQPQVIALTADGRRESREEILAEGMNDYVTKPIRVPELVQALIGAWRARQRRDDEPDPGDDLVDAA
jgi:CheY-like chemotaxis protein